MKLIDLLVQEIPRRGGWPGSQYDGEVMALDGVSWSYKEGCYPTAYSDGVRVIRSEYEAALAASQQPAWNGEGLPPVGCDFEYSNGTKFKCATMKYIGEVFAIVSIHGYGESWLKLDGLTIRKAKNEAERKREESVKAIFEAWSNCQELGDVSTIIYEAIASGKIPHITLK